jgi:hypothetical protein
LFSVGRFPSDVPSKEPLFSHIVESTFGVGIVVPLDVCTRVEAESRSIVYWLLLRLRTAKRTSAILFSTSFSAEVNVRTMFDFCLQLMHIVGKLRVVCNRFAILSSIVVAYTEKFLLKAAPFSYRIIL